MRERERKTERDRLRANVLQAHGWEHEVPQVYVLGHLKFSSNVSRFFQRKAVLITALGVIQLTCFPCVSCTPPPPSSRLVQCRQQMGAGNLQSASFDQVSIISRGNSVMVNSETRNWDTHPLDADFWLHKRMKENKREFFALSNLWHLFQHLAIRFLTLSVS